MNVGKKQLSKLINELKKCSRRDQIEDVRSLHFQATDCGYDTSIYLANTLISAYSKCGSMEEACFVFDNMELHTRVSWNAFFLGCTINDQPELTLQYFSRFVSQAGEPPSSQAFIAAVKACTSFLRGQTGDQLKYLEVAFAVHSEIERAECDRNLFLSSALVSMYSGFGRMECARKVFDRADSRDLVLWNTLLFGYSANGDGEMALLMLLQMQSEGFHPDARTLVAAFKACTSLCMKDDGYKALETGFALHSQAGNLGIDINRNVFVATAAVEMYSRCGSVADAKGLFHRTLLRDLVLCNSMMQAYAEDEEAEEALALFRWMMNSKGCTPDALTFSALLKACAGIVGVYSGKTIHAGACRLGIDQDLIVSHGLIDFYGKSGLMPEAQRVFDGAGAADVISWTSLMSGYAHHAETKQVFTLFQRLREEGVQVNGITLCCILNACGHAGLVRQGRKLFEAISSEFGVEVGAEHYRCMVDLLARANELKAALQLIESMPFGADSLIWMALLGGCKKWKNFEIGRVAFEALIRIDRKDTGAYVLMGNIYASRGMWEEQERIESLRVCSRAWRKSAGKSWWSDDHGKIHNFVVGEAAGHPQKGEIEAKLQQLRTIMQEQGYVPDIGSVFRKVSLKEKEDMLCGHSERLAIACALINSAPGSTVRIFKNLRICDDCHKTTAIISKVEQRRIICRDARRFHVFEEGKCSCNNFW